MKKWNKPYYQLVQEDRYPPELYNPVFEIAKKRVAGLILDFLPNIERPLIDLLANAYMIGMEDGANTSFKLIERELDEKKENQN